MLPVFCPSPSNGTLLLGLSRVDLLPVPPEPGKEDLEGFLEEVVEVEGSGRGGGQQTTIAHWGGGLVTAPDLVL